MAVVFFSLPRRQSNELPAVWPVLSQSERERGCPDALPVTCPLCAAGTRGLGSVLLMGALLGCGPQTFGWDGGPWPQSPLGDCYSVNGLLGTQCSLWLSFHLCKVKVSLLAPASGCCSGPCAWGRCVCPGSVCAPWGWSVSPGPCGWGLAAAGWPCIRPCGAPASRCYALSFAAPRGCEDLLAPVCKLWWCLKGSAMLSACSILAQSAIFPILLWSLLWLGFFAVLCALFDLF